MSRSSTASFVSALVKVFRTCPQGNYGMRYKLFGYGAAPYFYGIQKSDWSCTLQIQDANFEKGFNTKQFVGEKRVQEVFRKDMFRFHADKRSRFVLFREGGEEGSGL